MKKIIIKCNRLKELDDVMDIYNINLNDKIKKNIMYYISAKQFSVNKLKMFKHIYNLKYNDKCIKLYCNSKINSKFKIYGFIYLIKEGCNIKLNDLITFMLNINNKQDISKILNLMMEIGVNINCF